MTRITLSAACGRRLRAGHPWIFSNEIEQVEGNPAPGDAATVHTAQGRFLGTGYYNPHSLIAIRLLSDEAESIDTPDFFLRRLQAALTYRQSIYPGLTAVRLIYGESDALPGLVVDRYDDTLSVQFLTLGMDRRRDLIVEALQELLQPRAIIARNDVAVRALEGLDQKVEVLAGDPPEELTVTENGLTFRVDLLAGQKTGHFLDQKENHLILRNRVGNKRVLDLFCYAGSWALHAGMFGAREVLGIDISPKAVSLARENARRNRLEDCCRFEEADVFEFLRQLKARGETFDTVVLDPPAFVKSKKKLREAVRGYLTINRRAMEILAPGGFLVTCSCSHHMDRETFINTLRQAAAKARRTLRIIEVRGQAFDHPVLLHCPETEYLKCVILQAL